MPTFVDMFAGAGGFSEGFLQAEEDGRYYDFLLASDINPTCEVTHKMRYNHQLGLKTEFLTKDITDPDFIEELTMRIKDKFGDTSIDVLVGGPPCQSFSLAGERRKNDKKDDLFSYYIKVIEALRPKYFVMENVYGILNKDDGKIRERILHEIRNIVDYEALDEFIKLSKTVTPSEGKETEYKLAVKALICALSYHEVQKKVRENYLRSASEIKSMDLSEEQKSVVKEALIEHKIKADNPVLTEFCLELENEFVNAYRNNKYVTEDSRNVVRQALNLIAHQYDISLISRSVRKEISKSELKRSKYKEHFDIITDFLDIQTIAEDACNQCAFLIDAVQDEQAKRITEKVKLAIEILFEGTFATIKRIIADADEGDDKVSLTQKAKEVSLYNIESPIILKASDYGVPQNRIRVTFIGSRNDQQPINEIPATVTEEQKVTLGEAIGDLAYIGINEHLYGYDDEFLRKFQETPTGSVKRTVQGVPEECADGKECHTFSEWSRLGRLNPARFPQLKKAEPAYTSANEISELDESKLKYAELQNHETSNHNPDVQKRYALMRQCGTYAKAKESNPNDPLWDTKKRNYTVTDPHVPGTTVTTMADDFVHYSANRSLTVREMARLQSFDDSFVFQGKRSTGGDKRKVETPQFTQVGNAVPPLMARAIATEILKKIK